MTPTPEQLLQSNARASLMLQALDTANQDVKEFRQTVALMKKGLMDAESSLIEATIRQARIQEQLRILRNETVNEEITDRQQEIERFKRLLPELLTKV